MTEAMRPFLRDRKRDVPLCGTEGAVRRIMEWFTSGSSIQGQLEDAQYNEPLYAQLGWQDERHFDVVSSFWTVFACAVIVETRENKAYARSRRYYTFPDYVNYVTPWVPGGKYGSGSGEKRTLSFPERYFMRPAIGDVVDSTLASFPKLREFASLTHTAANFSPCPPAPFNTAKGISLRVHDFLPLFTDLIETHGGETLRLRDRFRTTIPPERLQSWKNWLIQNRERLFLESYYETYEDADHCEHIRSIPFFAGQSLSHPLPQTKGEVEACLDEMVRRIYERAEKMAAFAALERA